MTAAAHVIFCDEVRQEANGKLLYIGVYMGDIVFQILPANANITCVLYISQDKQSVSDRVMVHVTLPDGTKSSVAVQISQDREKIGTIIADDGFKRVLSSFFLPLQMVLTEGRIVVDVELDGEVIRAGALRVQAAPPVSEQLPPASVPPTT